MNEKEHTAYLKEFKAFAKKVTSPKESSRQFLIKAGINTKDGKLTQAYSE